MGLQEPAWWTWPEHYEPWDARYNRVMLPLYIRKAAHIFPMSRFILEENRRVLGLPYENATVTYSAPGRGFHPIEDRLRLENFRRKHGLPEQFILSVTRVTHQGIEGSTSFFPGKNPETTFRAFARLRSQATHALVFAGRRVREYLLHTEGSQVDLERVHFIDFVPYEELPLLYNLAELFVNPTYYEGCPNTVLEAMACGLPLVVANTGGSVDVGAGAALIADPYDPADFAAQMARILQDGELRQELRARSLRKAAEFNWEKTARLTIDGLVEAVHKSQKGVNNRGPYPLIEQDLKPNAIPPAIPPRRPLPSAAFLPVNHPALCCSFTLLQTG
jgi:glycosyltransferase involved in cell wall biosynthesis